MFWNSPKGQRPGRHRHPLHRPAEIFWGTQHHRLQKSRNLFIVDLVDEDLLGAAVPGHRGHLGGCVIDVKRGISTTTPSGHHRQSVVVDWYYKTTSPSGRTLLHYAKFVGDTLLFASEERAGIPGAGLV